MEHESFEDTMVARIMNEHFVPIKVDREERPDIDDVYMTACQLASGRGCGWPLNAIALSSGKPVWAGTYFPKKEWIKILEYFIDTKKNKPDELAEYATKLTGGIVEQDEIPDFNPVSEFKPELMHSVAEKITSTVDFPNGGRKGAPKFPLPNQYEFLLQDAYYKPKSVSREAVEVTLQKMALGGIYDQLGGGFARYSTDETWLVPHFEKMLYDNGQLISLYSHAYQVSGNPLYKKVVYETIEFANRELSHPEGGFFSSLDADSEGEEGLFYIWKKSEIDSILTETEAKLINKYYNVSKIGNWEKGENILHQKMTLEKYVEKNKLDLSNFSAELAAAKKKLFDARSKRIRPGLDDKILVSWNGLMIKGLLDAYRAFEDPKFLARAEQNMAFLEKYMIKKDGRIDRNFKDGKTNINAFLDDYAFTIQAMIELYQTSFDPSWLEKATKLTDYTIAHFKDEKSGLLFYTSDLDPPLITRKIVTTDNVIPGSNSSFALVLFQLGTLTYNEFYTTKAKEMLGVVAQTMQEAPNPGYYSNWGMLWNQVSRSPYEVAILGDDFQKKLQTLQKKFLPQVLYLGGKSEGDMALLKDKLQEGRTMIYVCQNKACKLPVEDPAKAILQVKPPF